MTKFINVVTVKVQNNTKKNYIKKIQNTTNFDGLISSKHIAIDFNTYCLIEEWRSKEALIKARKAIELINKARPLINEKSPEIEIIGSLGGTIIIEKNMNKNKIEEPGSSSLDIEKRGQKHFYHLYNNI